MLKALQIGMPYWLWALMRATPCGQTRMAVPTLKQQLDFKRQLGSTPLECGLTPTAELFT
jgi:hypothetical protein